MSQDELAGRRYSEKEVGALIQRATRIHEERSGRPNEGLSLAEIERIALELGVPAEDMRAAALELGRSPGRGSSLFGGPMVVEHTQYVPGTLSDEDWEDVVLELRRFTGRTGEISELGRSREWSHYLGEGSEGVNLTRTVLSASTRDEEVSLHLRQHFGIAWMLYPVSFALGSMAALILGEAVLVQDVPAIVGLAVTLGSGTLGMWAARTAIVSWVDRRRERLMALTHRLRNIVSGESAAPADESESQANLSGDVRIEIPEADPQPTDSSGPQRSRSGLKA